MRHDQAHRISVVWVQRLAIMVRSKENVVTVKIRQGDIRRVALLTVDEYKLRLRLRRRKLQHLTKAHALPGVVETRPSGDAVKIAVHNRGRQAIELLPCKLQFPLDQSPNVEVPSCGIKARHGTVMQHRPLESERLTGREPAGIAHFFFFALALVTGEHS